MMKYSSLIEALMVGDYDEVKAFLDSGSDPNWTEAGKPVLCEWMRGMEAPSRDLLNLLLDYGLDPNLQIKVYNPPYDRYFKTPLNCVVEEMTAARRARYREALKVLEDYMDMLLDAGADPSVPSLSLFHHPAAYGYQDMVERLAEIGADPGAPAGMTANIAPIISASRNLKMARLLESLGANPLSRDVLGQNPLFSLVSTFDRSIVLFQWLRAPISLVRHLVKAGNDPLERGSKGATLLHASAYGGHPGAIGLFLKKGVPVDALDEDGDTALHYAAYQKWLHDLDGALDVLDLLVGNGVPVDLLNGEGFSALHIAIMKRREEVALKLLQLGASPDVRTGDGRSTLELFMEAYGEDAGSSPLWEALSGRRIHVPVLEREEDYPVPERVSEVISLVESLHREWGNVLDGLERKDVFLLYPAVGYSAEGHLMKIGGPVPGVGIDRWPVAGERVFMTLYEEFEGTRRGFRRWWKQQRDIFGDFPGEVLPMEHFITVDLRLLPVRPEGVPEDAVAMSIFLPVLRYGLGEYLARGDLKPRDFYGLLYLTREDLEKGFPMDNPPSYTKFHPVPVLYRRVEVPSVAFRMRDPDLFPGRSPDASLIYDLLKVESDRGGDIHRFIENLLSIPEVKRMEALRLLHRVRTGILNNTYMGGFPIYLQRPENEKGFIMQISNDITEYDEVVFVNFGMGVWYVFSDRMLGQTG